MRTSPREIRDERPETHAPERRGQTIGLFALGLLIWLRHCELPQMILSEQLDTSWTAAMGRFLVLGKHAGTDWIFTAGPLAGLSSPVYQRELFWWKLLLWEGLWRLCSVLCLVLAARRIEGRLERGLCFLVLLVPPLFMDSYALALLFAGALLLDERAERRHALLEALVLLALAGAALVKFTLLVELAGLIAALALARGLREGRAAGLRLAGAASATLALLWFLSGQGLVNVWPYLRSSWEIAGAYSEAQSNPASAPLWRVLGLACVAGLASVLAWRVLGGGSTRAKTASAAGFCFVVFCAWKTGFVRAADHAQFFFCFAAPGVLLLPRPQARGLVAARCASGLRLVVFGLACLGIVHRDPGRQGLASLLEDLRQAPLRVYRSLTQLSNPLELERDLESRTKLQREARSLPKVSARVGRETIDMLGVHQGALLLAQLNWTPRPAFQGYITFTPWLQQQNADFLSGPGAPRYLLARIETIDERWPMMDDALALEVVERCYEPLFMEREYLLLERRSEPRPEPQREVVLERSLGFGEELELPAAAAGCAQVLTLEFEYTLAGRLVRLLDSTPELRMRLRREDGGLQENRIVPATMRSRVLIDPLIVAPVHWVRWMLGQPLPRCRSLSIDAPRGAAWMMQPKFRVHLESVRERQPTASASVEVLDWTNHVLSPPPEESFTPLPPLRSVIGGHELAVVHAPSRLVWRLLPGRYRLTGWYGMLPETWDHDHADGGDFVISTATDRGSQVQLLRREFRPGQSQAEHAMQRLELEFTQAELGRLVLTTSVGPGGNGVRDECYWSEVRLERLPEQAPPK